MSGTPKPVDAREREKILRSEIRERLARGVYAREKERDPTDRDRQSSWDDLNAGRKATRLNYADELLTTIVGALGFDWTMVEGLDECISSKEPEYRPGEERSDTAMARLRDVLAALVPRPVRRDE